MNASASLLEHPWIAVAAALGAFLLLFGLLQIYARVSGASPEVTRKLLHTGSGLLTLTFPFLFNDLWPVLLLTSASAMLVGTIKFVPALRARFGGVSNRVDRITLGEIYFPVAVAMLFWLTLDEQPLLFVIPVLMLTLADATGALVGGRYGATPYSGAAKSLEGSVAFAVVGFFCVHVPLLLWSDVGRVESVLIAATLALLVMLLEGSAWRGLDNLFVPIGGYFLLRAYLPLDAASLFARFLVTIGLVCAILASRTRTTLEDDSLVAGAFLAYVAWALMGWQWLIAPAAIFVGYSWLSPPTQDNSRRIHGISALLSIWAAAVAWLAIASTTGRPALLFPYTIVFAAHLAMFGISRLGSEFPERPLAPLLVRAVLTSWVVVLVPYMIAAGGTKEGYGPFFAAGAIALGAIALGAVMFVITQRDVRDAPLTRRRWMRQAAAAAVASIAAWISVEALSR